MRAIKKILIIFFIIIFLFIGALCGIGAYYYYHPAKVKSFIEKSISRSTGTTCTIKTLTYSLSPIIIEANGIILSPGENQGGFYLEIPALMADIELEGSFAHKSLIFKDLKVDGFSLRLSRDMNLSIPKIAPKEKGPSHFIKVLRRGMAFFLFSDIRFQAAEMVGGDIVAHLGDQVVQVKEIQANLNPDHLVEISCSTLIDWPSRKMSLVAPHVQMITDHAISLVNPEIKGLLTVEKAVFKSPEAGIKSMKVKAKLIYDHSNKKLTFEPVDLYLEGVTLKQKSEKELTPLNLHLKAKGVLDLPDKYLNAPDLQVSVDGILKSSGRLNVGFGPQSSIGLKLLDCHLLSEKILHYLPHGIQEMLVPVHLSGHINLQGDIIGEMEGQKWAWQYNMQARLSKNRYAYRSEQIRLNGMVTGKIQAEGRYPDIKISARVEGDKTILKSKGMELKPFKVSLSMSGRHPLFDIEDLVAHIPQARIGVGKRDISIEDIRLHIRKGRVDGTKKTLFLPEIELDSPWLKNMRLALELDEKQAVMQISGKGSNLIQSALDLNLLPSGWQFSGLDSMEAKVILKEKRYCSFMSQLGFSQLAFQNQDSSRMGENVSMNWKVNGNIDLKGSDITANGIVEVNGGEVLYDRFYLDLNRNALLSSFKGSYDISKRSLQLSSLILGLKDVLTVHLKGALQHKTKDPSVQLSLNIPRTSLKPIFNQFLLDPFKAEKPFLMNIDIGGDLSADLKIEVKKKDWIVKGHGILHNGELSWGDEGSSLRGIDLDLPVWYQHSTPTPISRTGQTLPSPLKGEGLGGGEKDIVKGKLSIQSMNLPILPEQPLSISLDAGPNQISVRSSTTIKIPGGEVLIGPIVCKGIVDLEPSIDTSISLSDIEIQPLLSEFWSRPIKGRIDGKLAPVHFEGGNISTQGKLKANPFNGEVIVFDIGASGIFTLAPVFMLSAEWKDLDLVGLTADTSFGKIQGFLEGYVKDLEIAYGQPQRFDLLLETVKKKGVPQRISVKAVDNIARIGGGQSPFMGVAGTFAALFKEFPYKKIGIHALLENDIFRINGTIKDKGREYLIKRSGFSGINVVNQNPDNRIKFKDMVKRIKRVTAPGSSPVIK